MVLEGQEPYGGFGDGLTGLSQRLQILPGRLPEGGEQGDLAVLPELFLDLAQHLLVGGDLHPVFALPTTGMGGDDLIVMVDGDRALIGLEDQVFADTPGRGGVGIGIEAHGKVLVHEHAAGLAAIGQGRR